MLRSLRTPQVLLLLAVHSLLIVCSCEDHENAILEQPRQSSTSGEPGAAPATSPLAAEVARVQTHIDGAIALIKNADIHQLSSVQRERRKGIVGTLRRYRDTGRFPKNLDYPLGLRPTFVDDEGTHCALAYLLSEAGEQAIVKHIAATRNHAYVRDLVDEPALISWLHDNGISVEEAARIQPGYSVRPGACLCPGRPAVVVGDARSTGDDTAVVEALYGNAAAAPSGVGSSVRLYTGERSRVLLLAVDRRGWTGQGYPYVDDEIECPSCGSGVSYCSIDGPLPKAYVIDALLSEDCIAFIDATNPTNYKPRNRPIENPPTHDPENASGFLLAAICFTLVSILLVAFAIFFALHQRRARLSSPRGTGELCRAALLTPSKWRPPATAARRTKSTRGAAIGFARPTLRADAVLGIHDIR